MNNDEIGKLEDRYTHLKTLRSRWDTDRDRELGQRLKDELKSTIAPLMKFCYDNAIQGAYLPVEDTDTLDSIHVEFNPLSPEIANVHGHYGSIYVMVENRDDGPLKMVAALREVNSERDQLNQAVLELTATCARHVKRITELQWESTGAKQREEVAARDLARFSNPWTVQIQDIHGNWSEFCHDAPVTLKNAEDRIEEMARDSPRAILRAVPYLNCSQMEHVRSNANKRISELQALLNTPELHDFSAAVVLEAQHQRGRWGSDHDAGKEPQDWFWLLGHLGGKALRAHASGDTDKALHHTISSAAVLANWHAAVLGASNSMRPWIDPVERGETL